MPRGVKCGTELEIAEQTQSESGPSKGKQSSKRRKRILEQDSKGQSSQESGLKTQLGKTKEAKRKGSTVGKVKAVFQESDNEVIFEVDEVEKEFPSDEESQNNNATLDVPKEKGKRKNSRASNFRNMVKEASQAMDADGDSQFLPPQESQDHDSQTCAENSQPSASVEEGEALTSEDERSDGNESFQSIHILPHSKEEMEREGAEYRKERDGIVQQAVDTTLDKFAQFLRKEGLVVAPEKNNPPATEQIRKECNTTGRVKMGEKTPGMVNDLIQRLTEHSSSGTTIYDRAILKKGVDTLPPTKQTDELNKRISSSSEESNAIDTSDEMLEVTEQIDNVNLIVG